MNESKNPLLKEFIRAHYSSVRLFAKFANEELKITQYYAAKKFRIAYNAKTKRAKIYNPNGSLVRDYSGITIDMFTCNKCKLDKARNKFSYKKAAPNRGFTTTWCKKCAKAKYKTTYKSVRKVKKILDDFKIPVSERIKNTDCSLLVANQMKPINPPTWNWQR
jgi:ribosomal protein L34E